MRLFGFALIDLIRGTKTVFLFKYLKKSQFNTKKQLDQVSKESLNHLWETCKHVGYYRKFKDYSDLPILTKDIVKNNFNAFLNTKIGNNNRIRKKTGGSTGVPFVYYTSKLSQGYLWAGILLAWDAAGWKPGNKVAFLAGSSILGKGWKQKIYYRLMNVTPFDSFDMTSQKMDCYLRKIKKDRVKYLYGYASAIYYLALHNLSAGKLINLVAVISTAENLSTSMRKIIKKSFDCEVFNQYGCNDAGLSAFECKSHNGLHLINTRAYVEVIDQKLVSTDTVNYAMPLIKYDSGDIIEFSDQVCDCGRGFPLIKEIKGRSNDVITNPNTGGIIHSEFFNHLFREDNEISIFQVKVGSGRMNICIQKLDQSNTPIENESKYCSIISLKTGYKEILFSYNEEFLKSNNGKIRTVINHE